MATAASDDLVMSNEDITSQLSEAEGLDAAEADGEGEEESQLDYDGEVESTWDDKGDGEEESAETDVPARKGAQAIRKIKAGGQTHEVNMGDEESVNRLLSLGLGARKLFSERDQLRKTVSGKDKVIAENAKYKDLWTKLEARKSDKPALYEAIWGESWEDAMDREVTRRQAYAEASPQERAHMDRQADQDAKATRLAQQEKEWTEREAALAERSEKADVKELRSQLLPEFHRYEFSQKVKDPARAEKLNAALWRMTISNLKSYGDDAELTAEQIRKEFKSTYDLLSGNATQTARQEVKKITEKKKVASKQQAQAASTRNYQEHDVAKLSQEKDPVKLFRKMFGR